jgi:hypothetical protein
VKDVVARNSQTTKISKTVAIQSLFPAHLKFIGLSGQGYEWQKTGDIVYVNEEDAPNLLSKRIGNRGCCGVVREGGNVLFQKYEEAVNA